MDKLHYVSLVLAWLNAYRPNASRSTDSISNNPFYSSDSDFYPFLSTSYDQTGKVKFKIFQDLKKL